MSKLKRDAGVETDTDDGGSDEESNDSNEESLNAVDKAAAMKQLPHIDRLCSLLKNDRYKPPLTIGVFNRKYIHSKVDSNIDKFPYKPLKRNIPWISVQKQSYNPNSKTACTLSEELLQLSKYLSPTEDEIQCRVTLIEDIADVIHAKFPSSSVEPFGSYCSNLSTFLSDIDISIEGKSAAAPPATHSDDDDDGDDDDGYEDETLGRYTSTSTSNSDVYNDSLSFNNIIVANTFRSPSNTSDSSTRFEEINQLGSIYHQMVAMSWMKAGEFRRRARVPIISLLHSNGIQCDVSIRTASNSKLIDSMKNAYHPELFTALASFLKIFLGQLELDKPFTGGIGSFKLYVMIAYILESLHKRLTEKQLAAQTMQFDDTDTEWVLIMLLKYFGDSSRFNESTVLRVHPQNCEPIEATFDGNNDLIPKCQRAFLKAYKVIANHESDAKLFQGKSNQSYSTSVLGKLIDTALLESQRQQSKISCKEYKRKSSQAKTHVARMILARLLKSNGMSSDISLESIRCVRPFYHVLLRSYASVEEACGYKKLCQQSHKVTHSNPNIGSKFSHTGVTGNGIYHSKPKPQHHVNLGYSRHHSKKYRR
jgi:hypothetical protein